MAFVLVVDLALVASVLEPMRPLTVLPCPAELGSLAYVGKLLLLPLLSQLPRRLLFVLAPLFGTVLLQISTHVGRLSHSALCLVMSSFLTTLSLPAEKLVLRTSLHCLSPGSWLVRGTDLGAACSQLPLLETA